MRKFIVVVGMLGLFAIPAIAQANRGEHPGAVRFCAFQRDRIGVRAFRVLYGRHAFERCVLMHPRERMEGLRDATADCSAERSLIGLAAFRAKYMNARDKRAFVRCVLIHEAAERAADQAARTACLAQKAAMKPAVWREFWGAGPDDVLAFTRCVEGTEQDTDSPTPQS
jgi:hypothetical protein